MPLLSTSSHRRGHAALASHEETEEALLGHGDAKRSHAASAMLHGIGRGLGSFKWRSKSSRDHKLGLEQEKQSLLGPGSVPA
jgi:nanoRNase/pAp phosphatase (c-di-AMP/oligoRNAs hydrolase)